MSDSDAAASSRNIFDVIIVALALGAVVAIALVAIDHYAEAKDVASVLAVILGPIATLVAAAYGVSQASQAATAKQEVQAKRQRAKGLGASVANVRNRAEVIAQAVEQTGESVPGARTFAVRGGQSLSVGADDISNLRQELAVVEQGLTELAD